MMRNVAGGSVDWAEIRRRIDAVGHAIAAGDELTPDRANDVLEKRARALAQPLAPPEPADTLEIVSFYLSGGSYAIESAHVREVFRLTEIAFLPNAKEPVLGLTAWRGDLLLLLDLRRGLGLSSSSLNDLHTIVVLEGSPSRVGILTGDMQGISTIPSEHISAAVGSRRHKYVRGVTSDAVVILETGALLRAGN